jgi:hypothetical protein
MKTMKLILAFIFCLLPSVALASDNLVVPVDLYEYIQKQGCEQVSDFYNRPAVENPPYALKTLPYGEFEFAVWCTKKEVRKYSLLLNFDDKKNPLAACPNRIDNVGHIGGLSFVDVDEPSKRYRYLDTREQVKSPDNIKTKAILSIYDGVGEYYVCLGGRWAGKAID